MICEFVACKFNCDKRCQSKPHIDQHGRCFEVADEKIVDKRMRMRAAADIMHIYGVYRKHYPVNYDNNVALAVAALLNERDEV